MLRYLFFFILICHGVIHLMGFAKAFGYGRIGRITRDISKQAGRLWLLATLLFVVSAFGYLFYADWWTVIAISAVVLSQILIILNWKDAKFGTIANLIILLVCLTVWSSNHFESQFIQAVKFNLHQNSKPRTDLLNESDIQSLPPPVQNYLRYSGAMGKPKLSNVRISFDGEMRGKGIDWFPFRSLQYNFFEQPTRLFYIKGRMYALTVPGFHDYQNGKDRMNIKLFGMIPVIHAEGAELDRTETVTYFNDLCLFAPAALIDKRIIWKPIDSSSAGAIFTNAMNKISATLYFNQTGQLVNFISDDRSPIDEMKPIRFSTPVKDYKTFDGRNIPTYGEAVWHYPDRDFVYGKFYLKSIEYNVGEFRR
jgi:hypothetical protein